MIEENSQKRSGQYYYVRYLLPQAKYEKKPLTQQFLCFCYNVALDIIWPKFCPKDHTHFTFFGWFPMKYVRGYS